MSDMEQKTPAQILKELRDNYEIFKLDSHAAGDRDDRSKARNRMRTTEQQIKDFLTEHPELE